jgi:hypothetical protein
MNVISSEYNKTMNINAKQNTKQNTKQYTKDIVIEEYYAKQNTKQYTKDIVIEEYYASQITFPTYVNLLRFKTFKDKTKDELASDFEVLLQMNHDNETIKSKLVKVINDKNYDLFKSIIEEAKHAEYERPNPYIKDIIDIYYNHSSNSSALNVLGHLLEINFDSTSAKLAPIISGGSMPPPENLREITIGDKGKAYLNHFAKLPLAVQGLNRSYRC